MTTSDRWLALAVVLVLAALWPASQLVGLVVLALAAFALRASRDLER
jgi:predicted anti-sigma-YlaC factor YlaD